MRSITFNIAPDVQITLIEQSDGTILCELVALRDHVNIRGLFFDIDDASLLDGLQITGTNVSSSTIADDGVTSLPMGVNMNGIGAGPFDIGIAFEAESLPFVHSTQFTLSADAPLTLDDFAHVDFGINAIGIKPAKVVVSSPAAPNAISDVLNVNEDNITSLQVLANDTDADGNSLTIISTTAPEHGTLSIGAGGTSVIYTPNENYSGTDSFSYTISDGNGGQDTAGVTLQVTPVADAPMLSVVMEAGDAANEIRLHVTTAVTDTNSEFIDRIVFSGLPEGAQIAEAPDGVFFVGSADPVDEYFTLVLAPGNDYNFNVGITSYSQETAIPPEEFGPEASSTQSASVLYESSTQNFSPMFSADDQNIWGTGGAFTFAFDQFIGIDWTGENSLNYSLTWDPDPNAANPLFYTELIAYFKTGLQPDISFSGGEIDVQVPVDVTVAMDYNKTTDMLAISPSFLVAGGAAFQVLGPEGHAVLDFIYELDAHLASGVNLGPVEIGPLEFGDPPPIDFMRIGLPFPINFTQNLINLDSDTLSLSRELGFGLTGTITWPDLDATGVLSGQTISSSASSENFLNLNLDVDQLAADLFFGGLNIMELGETPFDLGSFAGVVPLGSGTIDATLLDLDVSAGLNAIQNLTVAMSGMTGTLTFEDQTTLQFSFADGPINIANASQHDADLDGLVEFSVALTPTSTLDNNTSLGVNLGASLLIAEATINVNGGALGGALAGLELLTGLDLNPVHYGPLVDVGGEVQVATIPVFDDTFALNFQSQTFDVFA